MIALEQGVRVSACGTRCEGECMGTRCEGVCMGTRSRG